MRSLAWVLFAAGCAAEAPAPGAVLSEEGRYAVTFAVAPTPPVVGPLEVALELADAGGAPVEGATLAATPWMPDMNHGIDEEPAVAERGGGAYRVDFTPSMPGLWELRLSLDGPPGPDEATLSFEVE